MPKKLQQYQTVVRNIKMTILQFIVFELLLLFGVRIIGKRLNPIILLLILYPFWFYASALFCLEMIPYNPEFPRFNGFIETFSDYFLFLVLLLIGLFLILGIALIIELQTNKFSVFQFKIYFKGLTTVFAVVLFWGWIGIFQTPKISNKFFLKPYPTFKFKFKTEFEEPFSWEEKEKLNGLDGKRLEEELKFMQYVSNHKSFK